MMWEESVKKKTELLRPTKHKSNIKVIIEKRNVSERIVKGMACVILSLSSWLCAQSTLWSLSAAVETYYLLLRECSSMRHLRQSFFPCVGIVSSPK